MEKEHIVGILIGKFSSEEAKSLPCPYCTLYTCSENHVVGIFSLPQGRRWWLEWVESHPDVAGLEKAEVFFSSKVDASSPWTRGEVESILEKAPCGAQCDSCPLYQKECEGCPATVHYLEKEE